MRAGGQEQAGHEEKEDFAVGIEDLELLFERASEVEADWLGLEFAWELDDVAEDEDGLMVEDDGGVGGLGAVFAVGREPVGGGLVGILLRGKEEGAVGVVDVEEVAFVGDESEVAELIVEG